ncbi:hypothetical protein D3C74_438010 [compost metagenome]
MRINLARQHFELDFVLSLLYKIFLMIRFLDFLDQIVHASEKRIKLFGQQTYFIFTVYLEIRFPSSRSHFRHMLAQTKKPAG